MSNRRTEKPGNVKCENTERPRSLIFRAHGLTRSFSVLLFSVLLFFGFSSCHSPSPAPAPAFYHWKTQLDPTAAEFAYLDSLGVQKLYVKVFDVDWDEERQQPVPLARLDAPKATAGNRLEFIPTVFITNRTLSNLDAAAIPDLARRIVNLLTSLAETAAWEVKEIQLDCDWTETTRDKFFVLLVALRAELTDRPVILSATIRLHQIRYPDRTGVPRVDRGMLVCYNVGEVTHWEESNSILDAGLVAPYLSADDYPLPLDVALPVFGWGVLFRQGRMIRLINGLEPADLTDTARFTNLGDSRYEVAKSTYLQGYYLYRGDRLRLETAKTEALMATATLLAAYLPPGNRTVAFYHLDTTTIKKFPYEELERIIETVAGRTEKGNFN